MTRHTETSSERSERIEIENSLKTSTYLTDQFWEDIHRGVAPPQQHVPNYGGSSIPSEHGVSMDMEGFYRQASGMMTNEQMKEAVGNSMQPREDGQKTFAGASSHPQHSGPRFTLSRNQAKAVQKYPTVVEFLGRPEGELMAKKIASQMNLLIVDSVGSNSKEANESAVACKAENQNLKQYFQGDGWVCRVTAAGPFRGDEVIFYSKEKDISRILRKSSSNNQVRYADISENFNIIHELGEGEFPPKGEFPPIDVPDIVEASVEKTTSTEGETNVSESKEVMEKAVAEVLDESTT